jgi:5'-3' exonuclease
MEVHLVDGTYELFRTFYGAPERRAPDGREVGATVALLRSVHSLLTRGGATHVAVAFDHVVESFRNDLFDGYKTGDGIDPDLLDQFELAEEALHALGVVVWPMVELEADDALAAGAARYAADERVERILICTPDKDLAQCVVGERVVCLDRRRELVRDEAGVWEKFGVGPASIPDWLALVGDTADGIPGLRGWGARSSATVLAAYGHLEAIPPDPADWTGVDGEPLKVRGARRLSETLEGGREEALLYRTLATLRSDVPLEEELDDLRWRGARRAELEALAERLGLEDLPDRVRRWR